MKTNNMKWFLVGAITITAGLSVMATVNIPNSFTASTPIKASEVNANFSSLKTAVDALQANPDLSLPFSDTSSSKVAFAVENTTTNDGTSVAIRGTHSGQVGYGVQGVHTGSGYGVYGNSKGTGVGGETSVGNGVYGIAQEGIAGNFENSSATNATLQLRQSGAGQFIAGYSANNTLLFQITNGGGAGFTQPVYVQGIQLTSDRNAKTNFSSINSLEILEKVVNLPVSRWNYKKDSASLAHLGPMAQDFEAAFKLNGKDNKHISVVDEGGVALAAIQGLNKKLELQNAKLRASLAALEGRLSKLEQK